MNNADPRILLARSWRKRLGALVLILFATLHWPTVGHAQYIEYSTDTTPVLVTLRGSAGSEVKLKMPAAFLHWKHQREATGPLKSIQFLVFYPDMTPATLMTKAEKDEIDAARSTGDPLLRFESLVRIDISEFATLTKLYGSYLSEERKSQVSPEAEFDHYPMKGVGYEFYVPKQSEGDIDRGPVIKCVAPVPADPDWSMKRTNCEFIFKIDRILLIAASFPRQSLANWKDVESAVRKMILSFVQSAH
jgi:hypothetical protein